MDGELHAPLSDTEQEDADRLMHAVRAYSEQISAPDSRLDDAVLDEIREVRSRSAGWRWMFKPRAIRLRPVWVPVAAAAIVALVWLGGRPGETSTDAVAPQATALGDTVFVHFQLLAPEASQVAIAGSFSGWTQDALPLVKENGGLWSITLALPLGEHQYQFVVDGERWIPDPRAHAQIEDGFGGMNSVVIVGPKGVVQS
jgi:hypothetical protein